MVDTIAAHAREGLPMIGFNAGTLGFLLNDGTPEELQDRLTRKEKWRFYQQPLLIGTNTRGDQTQTTTAFNELFVKSSNNQAVWMRVTLDGVVRFAKLEGDGLMVSTPGGSTGWAQNYGSPPLLIGTPLLLLTGAGTKSRNVRWNSAPISIQSTVRIEILDPVKRPAVLIADGDERFSVTDITIRASRAQSVELGFFSETDLAEKISRCSFPG